MSLADELAIVATQPLIIRCAKCRWTYRVTVATLEQGRAAHADHRLTKHGIEATRTKRHRLHRTTFRSPIGGDIDTNIRAARMTGAAKWASKDDND